MLVYGKYECFVMQILYVLVLCASCGRSQCCTLAQWGERSLSERTAQVRFPVRPDKTYTVFC